MAYRLKFSARALRETGEAQEWYELQSPGLGAEFMAAMELQLKRLEQAPLLYSEGSSRNLMEKKFHFTAPLDCHVQLATVKEYPCSIAFEASKPSGSRL